VEVPGEQTRSQSLVQKLTHAAKCSKSVYPFHDGKYDDFQGIFEHLTRVCSHATPFPAAHAKPTSTTSRMITARHQHTPRHSSPSGRPLPGRATVLSPPVTKTKPASSTFALAPSTASPVSRTSRPSLKSTAPSSGVHGRPRRRPT
jgi:hypothetical protein